MHNWNIIGGGPELGSRPLEGGEVAIPSLPIYNQQDKVILNP